MGQSIVISDDEDGPIKVHRRSAAAGVILSDDDDSTQRSTSSEDEMISQNEEEGWASISQSFSSIEWELFTQDRVVEGGPTERVTFQRHCTAGGTSLVSFADILLHLKIIAIFYYSHMLSAEYTRCAFLI